MADTAPKILRADIELWPMNDRFFFDKLKLYAYSFEKLFSADEVGDKLIMLNKETFWNLNHRHELLHLLKNRWLQLSLTKREQLEHRVRSRI